LHFPPIPYQFPQSYDGKTAPEVPAGTNNFPTPAAVCFAASVSGIFGGFAILALLLPLAVSWSRVHMGRHDRAQVLAGTTPGILFGSLYLVFLHIQEITL
jgi:hypothetical protein